MPILEVNRMSSGYGSMVIVHTVSIKAEAGQIVSIIGPNGAGKSTLLKAVVSELKQDGEVIFKGENVSGLPRQTLVRKGLGYVPQINDVFPSLTINENLEMGGYMLKGKEMRRRRQVVLARFPQLQRAVNRAASTLSGGERKMLGIGRVLMAKGKHITYIGTKGSMYFNKYGTVTTNFESVHFDTKGGLKTLNQISALALTKY